jgi:hypothetical protein
MHSADDEEETLARWVAYVVVIHHLGDAGENERQRQATAEMPAVDGDVAETD